MNGILLILINKQSHRKTKLLSPIQRNANFKARFVCKIRDTFHINRVIIHYWILPLIFTERVNINFKTTEGWARKSVWEINTSRRDWGICSLNMHGEYTLKWLGSSTFAWDWNSVLIAIKPERPGWFLYVSTIGYTFFILY